MLLTSNLPAAEQGLSDLPRLVKESILDFLDIDSMRDLSRVNKAWNKVVKEFDGVFPRLYQEHFPVGLSLDGDLTPEYLPLVRTTKPTRQHFIALENIFYADFMLESLDDNLVEGEEAAFIAAHYDDLLRLLRAARAQEMQVITLLLQRFNKSEYTRQDVFRLLTTRDATMRNVIWLARERGRQDMLDEIYRCFCEFPNDEDDLLEQKMAILTNNATRLYESNQLSENLELACVYSATKFIAAFNQAHATDVVLNQFLLNTSISASLSLLELVYGVGNKELCWQVCLIALIPLFNSLRSNGQGDLQEYTLCLLGAAIRHLNLEAVCIIVDFSRSVIVDASTELAKSIACGRYDIALAMLGFSFPNNLPSLTTLLNTVFPVHFDEQDRDEFSTLLYKNVVEYFYDGRRPNYLKRDHHGNGLMRWQIYLKKISAAEILKLKLSADEIHIARSDAISSRNQEIFNALLHYDCKEHMSQYVRMIHLQDSHLLLEKLLQSKSVPGRDLEIYRSRPRLKATQLLVERGGFKSYCEDLLLLFVRNFQVGTEPLQKLLEIFYQQHFLQAMARSSSLRENVWRSMWQEEHLPTKVSFCFPSSYFRQWHALAAENYTMREAVLQFLRIAFSDAAEDKAWNKSLEHTLCAADRTPYRRHFFCTRPSAFSILANVIDKTFARCKNGEDIYTALMTLLRSLPLAQRGDDDLLRRCRFLSVILSIEVNHDTSYDSAESSDNDDNSLSLS